MGNKIIYTLASRGYIRRDYEVHFMQEGAEATPTLWEDFQKRECGAVIVERGSFSRESTIRGVTAVVEQMNLIRKYIPNGLKRMIETLEGASENSLAPA